MNFLDEQLKASSTTRLIGHCLGKLDRWRHMSYQLIDQLYDETCRELHQRSLVKLDEQRRELNQLRIQVIALAPSETSNEKTIDTIESALNHVRQGIKAMEKHRFHLYVRPLKLDTSFITIEESMVNASHLSLVDLPTRLIQCSGQWGPALAKNQRFLLIDRYPNLCLVNRQLKVVNESPCPFDFIRDMSWSSALRAFIAVTRAREIYRIDERTLTTQLIHRSEDNDWSSCVCSDSSLFVIARGQTSQIFQFNLLSPAFDLLKRWKPPHSCQHYELILHTSGNKRTLALVLSHATTQRVHFELRSPATLARLWSLELDVTSIVVQPLIRCSPFRFDQWLIVDERTSRLFQISKDGQVETIVPYPNSLFNALLFTSNLLAVRTKNAVHFHRILS